MNSPIKANQKVSPIGLYRRDITDPRQLAATTIGRRHLVDDLLEKLKRRGDKKSGQNHLFIGPRGIGKTHLLSLLAQGVAADEHLNNSYTIIRFPEESNRVLSFADLLLGIIDILAEVEDDQQWRELHEKLETEDDDTLIIDHVLPRLKLWHQQNNKVLLILMENMDVVFTQQIKKKQDIHRIRSLLMDNCHIVLVGTAPTFFPALNDVRHPLYDFFDIQVVEELDQEQTLSLIKTHLEWDKRDDLLQQFDQIKPRILAMHDLTGGNPRLIMMLYELIIQDNLAEVKTQFHQMLDRVTPFYQARIKDLPPQERALLETIALMRTQKRTPVNIARQFRKPRHQTSVLLKRMTESGYLSVSTNPEDKRSRLYRIKEGFFDIWLAMNESRAQRKYLPYLVDFFTLWYADIQQREAKRRNMVQQLPNLEGKDRRNALELLDYLNEAPEQGNEKYQAKIELAVQQLRFGDKHAARSLINETQALTGVKPNGLMVWMQDEVTRWSDGEQHVDVQQWMEKTIEYWREQRSGDLENAARLFHKLSLDFSNHGLHQLCIAMLNERLDNDADTPDEKTELLLQIARSQKIDGQLTAALESLNRALEIARQTKNRQQEGLALNNVSQIYYARGDYETSLDYLNQSLAIQQEIGDKAGLCATLFNIGHIHLQNEDKVEAMRVWTTVYTIAQKVELAQALDELEKLAVNVGLSNGLDGWENLARKMG